MASSEGVRVVIHPPDTEPYPHTEGFDVPPGYSATFGVKVCSMSLDDCQNVIIITFVLLFTWSSKFTIVNSDTGTRRPHHTSVEATPLASGSTTSRFQAGPPGLQGAAQCNCSIFYRWLPSCLLCRPSPAPIGRHRHVLRSTDQHGARRPELRSRWTTALEQSASQDSPARQRHRRILSAAEVDFV